jgi:hypothetical protein
MRKGCLLQRACWDDDEGSGGDKENTGCIRKNNEEEKYKAQNENTKSGTYGSMETTARIILPERPLKHTGYYPILIEDKRFITVCTRPANG